MVFVSHRVHVRYIYLHVIFICMVNVGKHTHTLSVLGYFCFKCVFFEIPPQRVAEVKKWGHDSLHLVPPSIFQEAPVVESWNDLNGGGIKKSINTFVKALDSWSLLGPSFGGKCSPPFNQKNPKICQISLFVLFEMGKILKGANSGNMEMKDEWCPLEFFFVKTQMFNTT